MVDAPEVIATNSAQIAGTVGADAGKHLEPSLLGLEPYQIVSIAMLVLLLIAFLGAKVHRSIAGGLDARIAAIRSQLDEAKSLRLEAETLREEYAGKIANAQADAAAMIRSAEQEAATILENARVEGEAVVARRQRMAEDRIAGAEREAVAEVRAQTARAAALASRTIIARQHDAQADRRMADEVIASI